MAELSLSLSEQTLIHLLDTEITNKKRRITNLEKQLHDLQHELSFCEIRLKLDEDLCFKLRQQLRA